MTLNQYRQVRKLYLKWANEMNIRWHGNDSCMDTYDEFMRSPKLSTVELLEQYESDKLYYMQNDEWDDYTQKEHEHDVNIFNKILDVLA